MAEDTADLTINSLQIVSSPIFHVDDKIFAELAADLSPQPAATLLLIFRDLLNQWSLRVQSGRFLSSVILQFERVMMLHGVPMEVNLDNRWFKQRSIHRHSFAYLIPAYEYMPRRSLAALYKDLSRLEDRLHWQIWMGTEEEDHRKFHQLRIGYQGERGQILHLVRNLNYRGFAAHYSYSLFTRMYQCHRARTQVLSVYTALLGSLQTILAPQRVNDVDFSEKLFQLAENCARSLGTLKDCPLFAFLSEILIALLVFDGLNAAVAMTGIELRCDKRFKNFKHFCYWQPYRRLLAYIMLEKDPGNLVIDAQILGEELEGQLGVMEDAAASVFAEAAIRLYVKKGLYDKFMNCVARYAKQVPRRAKGLLEYLQTTEYVEETDVVIDNACDPIENKLHPSEELWVRWCEKRLKSPARYGPLVEVYTNCCRVLFQFLDFGQNRANERAWWALLFVIQAVDQETVEPLWAERLDWWPAFHHEGILLSETAKDCRDVIFRVLRKELRRP